MATSLTTYLFLRERINLGFVLEAVLIGDFGIAIAVPGQVIQDVEMGEPDEDIEMGELDEDIAMEYATVNGPVDGGH